MRNKIVLGLFLMGCMAIFLAPAINGQPGGGGKGKKFGMGGMDAGAIFDMMAKGKPSINISDMRFGKDQALQYAQDKGITSGTLNRQQYIDFQAELQTKMYTGGPGMGGPGGGGKGKKFNFGGPGSDLGAPGAPVVMQAAPVNVDVLNQLADASFKKLDANGDGELTPDEMPGPLKFSLAKWDKNGNGTINLTEYREYFAARLGGGGGNDDGTRGIAAIVIEEEELDRKTLVYRAGGKMPPGLPPWFIELDKDEDGQVALYEWRKGGKPLDEFRDWDLNDDGFITPDEAVKHQASLRGTSASSNGPSTASASSPGERPQFGGYGKGGGGAGDFFKKGKKGKNGGGNN